MGWHVATKEVIIVFVAYSVVSIEVLVVGSVLWIVIVDCGTTRTQGDTARKNHEESRSVYGTIHVSLLQTNFTASILSLDCRLASITIRQFIFIMLSNLDIII